LYRIRLHGRGGQGIKTAGRILGSAFFAEGFEVQDAPRFGAERRGAPLYATVRAGFHPIDERGEILRPDLVVLADETLAAVPAAGVLAGVDAHTLLLINSSESPDVWRGRLALAGAVLTLSVPAAEPAEERFLGATCAGAAARCVGAIPRAGLEAAIREEVSAMGPAAVEASLERALFAFDRLEGWAGRVRPGASLTTASPAPPEWIELPFDDACVSAPHIHAGGTSVAARTGIWRTRRPELDRARCRHCHWICSTFCPDGVIAADSEGAPEIDFDHCKGCLVCVAVCPHHALEVVPERGGEVAA
jgi:pyruvate ferredoxin oxidoreductase gamma subunit